VNLVQRFAATIPKAEAGPEGEAKALETIRREASSAGATLAHAGRGGLPSSMALGVFRRDQWRCKRCGLPDNLELHHKGDLKYPPTARLARLGTQNKPSNIVTVCATCHDVIHRADEALGG
jgi:hypothetical protein